MTMSGITLSMALWVVMAVAPNAEDLYTKGEQLFQQQKYAQSDTHFRQTVQALEARKKGFKKGSKTWNYLEFGQADAIYYRAKIALLNRQKRSSCRLFDLAITKLKGLPKSWPHWNVKEDARKRLQRAQTLFPTQCSKLASIVRFELLPSTARIERKLHGKWVAIRPSAQGQLELQLLRTPQLRLRLTAPNYKTLTKTLQIKPWTSQKVRISLEQKPKKRTPTRIAVIPRRHPTPTPPNPIYKKAWFWLLIGGGVAAVTVGVVAGVALSQPYKEGLRDQPDVPGFSLW